MAFVMGGQHVLTKFVLQVLSILQMHGLIFSLFFQNEVLRFAGKKSLQRSEFQISVKLVEPCESKSVTRSGPG